MSTFSDINKKRLEIKRAKDLQIPPFPIKNTILPNTITKVNLIKQMLLMRYPLKYDKTMTQNLKKMQNVSKATQIHELSMGNTSGELRLKQHTCDLGWPKL